MTAVRIKWYQNKKEINRKSLRVKRKTESEEKHYNIGQMKKIYTKCTLVQIDKDKRDRISSTFILNTKSKTWPFSFHPSSLSERWDICISPGC